MVAKCIHCAKSVTANQQAVACDMCDLWQHRKCETGITIAQYQAAVRGDRDIDFVCLDCFDSIPTYPAAPEDQDEITPVPVADSSHLTQNSPVRQLSEIETTDITNNSPIRELFEMETPYATYSSSVIWRCSVRSKKLHCPVTIKQVGESYQPRGGEHIHPSNQGKHLEADCISEVKTVSLSNPHRPASDVVEDVMLRKCTPNHVVLPKKEYLLRITNRCRAKLRPSDPKDLDFEINRDYLQCDDFLIDDIRYDGQRHIIFATEQQVQTLSRTKRWFIDGTFKVMNEPWKRQGQLFTIHGFVNEKQFPLVFVMMSRKTKSDYIEVFRRLQDKLPGLSVEGFVADFEAAAWLAVREVFPGATIKGCVFHWTQAVWRHIQQLGLATTYRQRQGAYDYMKQLMALPFLPAAHIDRAFRHLETRANNPKLVELVQYIDRQWMRHSTFDIPSWSVFQEDVRTNNDVEGWHHRLNRKAESGIGFYRLVPLLRREANLVDLAIRGTDQHRRKKKKYRDIDEKLIKVYQDYLNHDITTTAYLRTCGSLYSITETRAPEQTTDQPTE